MTLSKYRNGQQIRKTGQHIRNVGLLLMFTQIVQNIASRTTQFSKRIPEHLKEKWLATTMYFLSSMKPLLIKPYPNLNKTDKMTVYPNI